MKRYSLSLLVLISTIFCSSLSENKVNYNFQHNCQVYTTTHFSKVKTKDINKEVFETTQIYEKMIELHRKFIFPTNKNIKDNFYLFESPTNCMRFTCLFPTIFDIDTFVEHANFGTFDTISKSHCILNNKYYTLNQCQKVFIALNISRNIFKVLNNETKYISFADNGVILNQFPISNICICYQTFQEIQNFYTSQTKYIEGLLYKLYTVTETFQILTSNSALSDIVNCTLVDFEFIDETDIFRKLYSNIYLRPYQKSTLCALGKHFFLRQLQNVGYLHNMLFKSKHSKRTISEYLLNTVGVTSTDQLHTSYANQIKLRNNQLILDAKYKLEHKNILELSHYLHNKTIAYHKLFEYNFKFSSTLMEIKNRNRNEMMNIFFMFSSQRLISNLQSINSDILRLEQTLLTSLTKLNNVDLNVHFTIENFKLIALTPFYTLKRNTDISYSCLPINSTHIFALKLTSNNMHYFLNGAYYKHTTVNACLDLFENCSSLLVELPKSYFVSIYQNYSSILIFTNSPKTCQIDDDFIDITIGYTTFPHFDKINCIDYQKSYDKQVVHKTNYLVLTNVLSITMNFPIDTDSTQNILPPHEISSILKHYKKNFFNQTFLQNPFYNDSTTYLFIICLSFFAIFIPIICISYKLYLCMPKKSTSPIEQSNVESLTFQMANISDNYEAAIHQSQIDLTMT